MEDETIIKRKTNPYGANQYLLDPRQKMCWDSYVNPKSETFGNATQSAIKAGYDDEYAEQITTSEWFLVKLRRLNMLNKAEKNLNEVQELEIKDELTGKVITDVLRERNKVDMFVAERVGKAEGWAARNEVTGADGKDLIPVDKEAKEKTDAVISNYLNKEVN